MIFQKELHETGHYDILVVGGGVAGVAAAVQAARDGKHVLLLEKAQKLGGLATLGLINLFVPMCNGRGKQIIFGMAEELLRLSVTYGYGGVSADFVDGQIPAEKLAAYAAKGQNPPRYMTRYPAEIFALQLTELCVKEGVTLLFDTLLTHPIVETENGVTKVIGVVVENKSGMEYYTADMFVDATGDCDLVYRAGIPTVERGNFHTYNGFMVTLDSCRRAVETGNIERAVTGVSGGGANLYGGGHPAEIPLYHGTTSGEVDRYLITNQLEMLEKLKKQERLSRDVVTLPGMCQFRTTRRIDGDYVLQERDTYVHFADSVGAICDFDRRDYLYEIPYRTLTTHKAANLITCGRTAAGDGYAWDVLRVIPPAIISGQAAGLAASHAIAEGKNIADIDMPKLQSSLERANVGIHFDDGDVPDHSVATVEHND